MTDDERDAIRVASIPATHPYVENLSAPNGGLSVTRLADPVPPGGSAAQWWPPVMLDADWVRANAASFDVMHVHFGTESYPTEHLVQLVAALRDVARPFVYTVHDLVNPQLDDQTRHLEHLAVLIPAADEVVTLTEGAADEVEHRFGRRPTVIGHPHLLPLTAEAPVGVPSDPYVIGVNLRDLRPNIEGERIVDCLIRAVTTLRGSGIDAIGRIELRERVRDETAAQRIVDLVATSDAADAASGTSALPVVELIRTPRLSDEDLAGSIADLDVALLPYRHGTHSGWVELCFDLGVPVAGPAVGFAGEQHSDDFALFDSHSSDSLVGAVLDLVIGRTSRPGTHARRSLIASRRAERRLALHAAERMHRTVYERAMGRVAA